MAGSATGEPGKGLSAREYCFELGGAFCRPETNLATSPRRRAQSRRFTRTWECSATIAPSRRSCCGSSTRGFVNEHTLDSLSSDGKRLDFVTVGIENIPPGMAPERNLTK